MKPEEIADWPAATADPLWQAMGSMGCQLSDLDGPSDSAGAWPETSWNTLVENGANRWAIGQHFGAENCPRDWLIQRYGKLAESSLTAAFILTQHDAAVRRLVAAADRPVAQDWLQKISSGLAFTTVGLSQLTTSRRHGVAALRATPARDGRYEIDGVIPWVTAAVRADVLVAGAIMDDDQLLFALPTNRSGVTIQPPFELAALQASCTSEVVCDHVQITREEVLIGPCPDVIAIPGVAGTGGLETSALALGQARAAIIALAGETRERGLDAEPVDRLNQSWASLVRSMLQCLEPSDQSISASEVRRLANSLVLAATQAYLTARKGSGFLRHEPAQRWARQALFFLVWSCPSIVAQAAIRDLSAFCGI